MAPRHGRMKHSAFPIESFAMRRIRTSFVIALAAALSACTTAPVVAPASPTVLIGQVQGSGERSPLAGQRVDVEGIVAGCLPGLRLCSLLGTADGDAATSDAVFIDNLDFAPGTRLRGSGSVVERDTGSRSTLTVLEGFTATALGQAPLPAPQPLDTLQLERLGWESLEAMPVAIHAPLVVAGTQNAARFGEWQVALGERPWTPTERVAPGEAANALGRENRARMAWLDDGEIDEKVATAMRRDIPRAGSVIEGASGIVDERFGRHRLQMVDAPRVQPASRPAAPARTGEVRIAAMNLENLFNGNGQGGGFPTERGAKTHADYLHQRAKLVMALAALDADVVALMELENDAAGSLSSEAQLVAALNAVQGGDWRAVPMPANASTDAIRVGIIYRASKVRVVGAPAVLDAGPFATLSRPPLLQAFRAGNGPVFHVAANHFKSKGCRDAKAADADQRDGQSCWSATRVESARLLDGWLRTRLGGKLAAPVVILGDLNAYAMEDAPRWLRDAGWRDAFAEAGIAEPYSYVYEGQRGRLDHALITPAMAARLTGAAEWHINADEPDMPEPAGAPVTPFRSSDHDPLVIDLRLRSR